MASTGVSAEKKTDRTLLNAAIIIVAGVLSTTLSQPQVLARLPIQNLLKNGLHASRSANAAFFFWITLPWYFKPIAGIVTDAFPLFGSRRRSYILINATMATLMWVGVYFTPHRYNLLLWMFLVMDTFMVVASTVVGAYMVEIAQAFSGSGRLTATRNFVQQASWVIAGPTGGFLGSIAFGWTTLACGSVMFLLVPVTLYLLHERRQQIDSRELLSNATSKLRDIATAGTMWAAAGLSALFYIAPGLSTATFYRQQNLLHMDTQGQGFLLLLSGVCGIGSASLYGAVCKRFNLRTLMTVCLSTATLANLGYLFYTSVPRARAVESFNGFGYTLAEIALMDLAVRATPRGCEGLGFSLMMSVRNLALYGTDWLGSKAIDAYHVSFNHLVIANGATTLLTVPLVFLLPAVLMRQKEGEPVENAGAPRTALPEEA